MCICSALLPAAWLSSSSGHLPQCSGHPKANMLHCSAMSGYLYHVCHAVPLRGRLHTTVGPADPRVGLLGAMQSLFEGSMYTFVFLWTPALSPDGEHIPHGMIFACFMVSSMAGSALAGRLLASGSGSALLPSQLQCMWVCMACMHGFYQRQCCHPASGAIRHTSF